MIKALRILLEGGQLYENVEILNPEEQSDRGIASYFIPDDHKGLPMSQVCWRSHEGVFATVDWNIIYVHLSKKPTRVCAKHSRKVEKLTLSTEFSCGPAWLINPGHEHYMGIPTIFSQPTQFAFVNDHGLFLTLDFNVSLIKV